MVVGLLGNESSDSNRFTLVTPKSENDVRLQATLGNQNPTGLPVGVVSDIVSAGSCEMEKRYGVVYVDADNFGQDTYKRYKKDSFKWYHDFIENKHKQFN